jgi:putative spermidine/putrescine transport system substrate-binding protein
MPVAEAICLPLSLLVKKPFAIAEKDLVLRVDTFSDDPEFVPSSPTLSRRSLLMGVTATILSQLLVGCGRGGDRPTLSLQLLEGSIPPQLLKAFQVAQHQAGHPVALKVRPRTQLQSLFDQLQTWKTTEDKKVQPAQVVALGDYWLTQAIQQQLIRPIGLEAWPEWHTVPIDWRNWATRNDQGMIDATGQVWGVPFRWGSVVIAYRTDKVDEIGGKPNDWGDLWRSQVTGKISLPDSARLTIGLTLKDLGYSFNSKNLASLPDLDQRLKQLHQQVKVYSSDAYLQPLLEGDTWMAVGWSTDIIPLLERDRRIGAIVPKSGTALTADVWVCPSASSEATVPAELIMEWLKFWLQPDIAQQLSFLSFGASPILATRPRTDLAPELSKLPYLNLLLPPVEAVEKSELLSPLSVQAESEYQNAWLKVRRLAPTPA